MKKKLVLFLINISVGIFFNSTLIAQTWITLASGTDNFLLGVSAPSADTCYASGIYGTILKTSDGGCTWESQLSGTAKSLYSIYFTNNYTGYAVGNSGIALKTIDGGVNWTAMSVGSGAYSHRCVYFINSNIGFITSGVSSFEGTVFKTPDAGASWYVVNDPTTWNIYSIYFTSLDVGYFNEWGGNIYKTIDGGESWDYLSNIGSLTTGILKYTSNESAVVTGLAGNIIKTNDQGATWNLVDNGTSDYLTGLDFYDSNHGFAVGGISDFTVPKMLETVHAGYAWVNVILDSEIPSLFRIDFVDETNIGYTDGVYYYILNTPDGKFYNGSIQVNGN